MLRIQKRVIRKGDWSLRGLGRKFNRDYDLEVGIIGRKAKEKKRDYRGLPRSITLGEVAILQERGTQRSGGGSTPMRPVGRLSFTKNQKKYHTALVRIAQGALLFRKKFTFINTALNLLGKEMADDMRKTILMRIPPPLATKTVRNRRGARVAGTTPLAARGQLFKAFSHRLRVRRL